MITKKENQSPSNNQRNHSLDKWLRLLKWFCPASLYEGIEGDLLEQFDEDVINLGEKKAKSRFALNVIRFFRPGIILKNRLPIRQNKLGMLFNHLQFTIRLFSKDKVFSTLNLLGLALGITVSIILLLIVQYDVTYDHHYNNHERIYRLGADVQGPGLDVMTAKTSRKLCAVLKDEFPEIEVVTRINDFGNATGHSLVRTSIDGKEVAFNERLILRSDSDYFKVFNHEFLLGDPQTCLKNSTSAVITESTAKRFYNNDDPIGKTFTIDGNGKVWSITAVIKDLAPNTHLKFNILLAGIETLAIGKFQPGVDSVNSEDFWSIEVYMYMLLPKEYDTKQFFTKWQEIHKTYFKSFGEKTASTYTPILQSMDSIHFGPVLDQDQSVGNIYYFYAICGIGLLIILLACINYVNLSTAKASKRAVEVGMRKAMGSQRSTLTFFFLCESILLSLLSFVIAFVLALWILNSTTFIDLFGREISIAALLTQKWITIFGGIALMIGIFSGIYPSIYLAQTPPISALKGTYKARQSTRIFKQVLITVQFVISMLVVLCALFMNDQILYLRNRDIGLNKDNVVVIHINDKTIKSHFKVFETELLQHPGIEGTTMTQTELGENSNWYSYNTGETDTGMQAQKFDVLAVDKNFLQVLDIKIVAGRGFTESDDYTEIMCNEEAVKIMGWGQDAIGKKVGNIGGGEEFCRIIGVVNDFNLNSLHHPMEPLLLIKANANAEHLHVKISGTNIPETIRYIGNVWSKYSITPFEYSFLDQQLDAQYRSDEKQYRLISILSYVCIFISLLGIIGLSAFSAIQRTKEIGIRKVLGASFPKIILLLSKNVLLLVLLAVLIVVPLSYWLIQLWLQNFAYKTELNYLLYGLVTFAALSFVFVTVFLQSYKTATTNPVKSLKYE